MSAHIDEDLAALERAERYVAEVEGESIDLETGFPDYAHAPAIATARAAFERLRDAVQSFHDAYPEEVFPPLTKEQHKTAVEALRAAGVTSDQLHADWARRIVASIFRIAGEAD